MKVLVLGAGVIGVTTAYYLARDGHDVTIVESADQVASGSSYANGGQLSYSFTDSLARPSFLKRLPTLLLGCDPSTRISASAALFRWGFRFLGQCTGRRATENTTAMLRLAVRSGLLLDELRRDTGIEFAYRKAGKLVLLSDRLAVAAARRSTDLKKAAGADVQLLGKEEAVALEPALDSIAIPMAGAVYSREDAVGDSRQFVAGLASRIQSSLGVHIRLGCRVQSLRLEGDRIAGIETSDGEINAPAVVVCLGAYSAPLLWEHGIRIGVYPVRGYSVTLPSGSQAPSVSVTALRQGMVFSHLNGRMRIAGLADFVGFDASRDAERTRYLLDTAQRIAPAAANYASADCSPWGGFRPMCPDGRPHVGRSKFAGLWLNTGHGMLGWTLACATGYDLARKLSVPS